MDPERHARISELFLKARELGPDDRAAFLDDACGTDRELRAAVESLLERDGEASALFVGDELAGIAGPPGERGRPEAVGPYRIVRKLGEGGMGVVYLAEQAEPVERRVAVKLIKWGMDTRQVVARFETERQALALMDHPSIARVFEAGATPKGRPYFVMEYVEGEPIAAYCDRHRLTTEERLRLFIRICRGVQHAHQKGIIHRDLKPSNVLVAVRDGSPVPKIIDFGVAKATDHRSTQHTVYTQGQMIGTPEYMSPEQAEPDALDVDSRTDVYALGVILYELLVGTLPFDSGQIWLASLEEVRRRIREDEPIRPSTRISSGGRRETEASASRRRTDAATLRRQLRGELDWITMKALEKDRTRRYDSANELAADIERHLSHEPVSAGPPGAAYRLRKFVRRHRIGVGVAVAAILVLLAFAGTMTVLAARIARERDRANLEAQTSRRVSEFLSGLFEVSDPSEARGNSITARELLDRGSREIDRELADQPELQVRLMTTMGDVYRQLGLYAEAEPLLKRAVDIRERLSTGAGPESPRAEIALADLYWNQGRYDEAERLYVEALATGRRELGDHHPDTLLAGNNLANLYFTQGRYDEAGSLLVEALQAQRRVLGDEHRETLLFMNNLANVYLEQGRHDEAEPLYREALEIQRRVLGNDHPDTTLTMTNLASLHSSRGAHGDAERLFLEALAVRRRVLGDDHPDTLHSMDSLGVLYTRAGRIDEAEPLFVEALAGRRRVLGDDHHAALISMNNLAAVYRRQGHYDRAEPLLVDAVAVSRRVLGDDHPNTLHFMGSLGGLYTLQGRPASAEPLLAETVERAGRTLPAGHRVTGQLMRRHGVCLAALERFEEAETALIGAHDIALEVDGADSPGAREVVDALIALYGAWGRPERSAEWRTRRGSPE